MEGAAGGGGERLPELGAVSLEKGAEGMSVDEVAKSVREGAAKCGVEEVQGEVVEVWKEEEGELDGE